MESPNPYTLFLIALYVPDKFMKAHLFNFHAHTTFFQLQITFTFSFSFQF